MDTQLDEQYVSELAAAEHAKYAQIWQEPSYRIRCHGLELWETRTDLFVLPSGEPIRTALDIGCGTGRLFRRWNAGGIEGYGFDITAKGLDTDHPNRASFKAGCMWDNIPPLRIINADDLDGENRIYVRFDLGVCADVMEHIPPRKVEAALRNIGRACEYVVFKIANFPSCYMHGELHLTLQSRDWWYAELTKIGLVKHVETLPSQAEYIFTVHCL